MVGPVQGHYVRTGVVLQICMARAAPANVKTVKAGRCCSTFCPRMNQRTGGVGDDAPHAAPPFRWKCERNRNVSRSRVGHV
uniref:Uncharacterized protein n=1 Tax=Setaria viridis TaxID=4556 RepID=A0A4U6VLA7_SETVI|nr:hypothetical protein SEVIR_3G367350v2 [Setaria viridis]